MAKILLTIQDLQVRALAELQKQPGCSSIRRIAINRVADTRAEHNWSMCVLSAGVADANTAAGAALNVQRALRHDYDLTTD
jgi:5'-deoxynucleotidase YfbR-like HD superfamily hydrolase